MKPSGNETIAAENEYPISIFPNPTQSFFGINGNPKHNYLVNILDAKGSIIYRSSGSLTEINNNLKMNCPAANGMYLVRIKDMETGQSTTEKLIKK
ncbi:MAG: T9SS type A sorting domain-containing protein [Bacteroidetes bacterium]|nr:T9SS type A sorting domain-containing protein [Bacteroidota bacterium]